MKITKTYSVRANLAYIVQFLQDKIQAERAQQIQEAEEKKRAESERKQQVLDQINQLMQEKT